MRGATQAPKFFDPSPACYEEGAAHLASCEVTVHELHAATRQALGAWLPSISEVNDR